MCLSLFWAYLQVHLTPSLSCQHMPHSEPVQACCAQMLCNTEQSSAADGHTQTEGNPAQAQAP